MAFNNSINANSAGIQSLSTAGVWTGVAPSATTGVPVISQGSSSTPIFGTATVPGGGTGVTTLTAYSLMAGGTTSTGNIQQVSGLGTSGQILTSNGAGALPSWQSIPEFSRLNTRVIPSSGTYTPTAGMVYCIVELVGGGGGGGGANTVTVANNYSLGAGGGGGGYCRKLFTAADIGASKSVTVGTGGPGGVGNNSGSTGGTTEIAALSISATGGTGGNRFSNGGGGLCTPGTGGTSSGGDLNASGGPGRGGLVEIVPGINNVGYGGGGGSSIYGGGGIDNNQSNTNGVGGTGYGGGGAGALNSNDASNTYAGGAGSDGVIIITEYIS